MAIGFLTLGTVIGKDLAPGTALICSFGGLGMLLIASFGGERFRDGAFTIGWLYALSLLIGLGLGPTIAYFTANQPGILTQAAGGTALTVLGMGARSRGTSPAGSVRCRSSCSSRSWSRL